MTNVIYSPVIVHGKNVPHVNPFLTRIRWKQSDQLPSIDVSNMGTVRNHLTKEIIWPFKCKGYRMICVDGKKYKVARLVGFMFIPNPENKACINHKNGVKDLDAAENLEWATISENTSHAINELGYINNFGKKEVDVIKDGQIVFKARSVSEAARFAGGQSTQVSRVLSGKRTHYKEYQFAYAA